ncbi:hypothetical protein C7974DRAFT_442277 [Boeremia exigua]|uniref:uncharacterized protein n=1 Tax=Boeremia exigua TaxID=749465 RepID=UPI001E8D1ACD|nr:uncharacterized protein C7974DRAFT_442277 [Boeremia exigua]KAH6616525.1 hypothetical protein C7974DRAFT_442277 [Boeremia exigua]
MLNSPDRQRKFELLRAHWEAAEVGEQRADMVGRREKQALHRQPSNAPLGMNAPGTNNITTEVASQDVLLSPQADSISVTTSSDPPAPPQDVHTSEDLDTSTHLARSGTFSYLPRPTKANSATQPVTELDEPKATMQDTVMTDSSSLSPTRIPTPSLPRSKRRVSSPRQHLPINPSLQPKTTANRRSLTEAVKDSPLKSAVRSQTTSNLVKTTNTLNSASYLAPRRTELKRYFASSARQQPVLAENMPTNKRVAQRRSHMQDGPVKRESLAMPSAVSSRRSIGPLTPLAQHKRASLAPSSSTKHSSLHLSQEPVTVIRSKNVKKEPYELDAALPLVGMSAVQSQSNHLTSSPTPTLSTVNLTLPPLVDVSDDTQRRTLGTSNGLGGVWRSSKIFATANHQVRRLPRASTYHYFGRHSNVPPVPAIPDQYKEPSISNFTQPLPQHSLSTSSSKWHHRIPMASDNSETSSKSLLSEIATAQRSTEAASLKSSTASSNSSSDLQALPPMPTKLHLKRTRRSISSSHPPRLAAELQTQRHWNTSDTFYPDNADDATHLQVKDYMPPLYWAGRFQSRFDRWRTEAMVAMLHPEVKSEDEGLLGQCSLDEEKKATILIFMQLRDLCATAQAGDSLHEFEYRYRKDHKLLDTKFDLPPSLRKPEESTPKGPIGRAVRKLTPRKASFANLFKGKGWNKTDDLKAEMPGHVRELQEIEGLSTSHEDVDSDSYGSSTQLHAL